MINGVRNVDPAIAESVQRAVSETGYVPNRAARSLVTGRTYSVALVVSAVDAFGDPFPGHALTTRSSAASPVARSATSARPTYAWC